MSVTLPQELIDEILSYGDVYVTQKHDSVINQINYHRKMLDIDSIIAHLCMGQLNLYSGITDKFFYLYILDKSYIKKNIYRSDSKYFRFCRGIYLLIF